MTRRRKALARMVRRHFKRYRSPMKRYDLATCVLTINGQEIPIVSIEYSDELSRRDAEIVNRIVALEFPPEFRVEFRSGAS